MAEERRRGLSRRGFLKGAAIGAGVGAADLSLFANLAGAETNPIAAENALAGTDAWDLLYDDDSIEGFPDPYSVNAGETVRFKIQTDSADYRVDIYRLGYYGGPGGRLITTLAPTVALPQTQPAPTTDPNGTGVVDCHPWATSAEWVVPANAVSGVYQATFVRQDQTGGANRCLFVVRNDGRQSDVLVQTSDTTWHAYNRWGGNSLYAGSAYWGRATKVSYNRPILAAETENTFQYGEYPLVRWLERNGYDVTYCGGIDSDARPGELLVHKVFVSSGHDEYWSGPQRANVEAARDAGVHLVFMTGNEVYWKVRWEPDGAGNPRRTMACYKETLENAKIDPSPEWTGTWRDPRFSPPSDGGRPENELTGQLFKAINPVGDVDWPLEVPYQYSRLRMWRNTSVAALQPGEKATLAAETLGYEFDVDVDNGVRPAGQIRLSETTVTVPQVLQDHGGTYAPGSLTHHISLYRAASGALVWGLGTVQWAWGLDEYHLTRPQASIPADVRMQQATLNVLADMGVQPSTRQAGLVAASSSTDTIPPVSTITSPPEGATFAIGVPVTVTGTASDSGGGEIAGVEVSTDDGLTWHPATGTDSWSYTFTPAALGVMTLRSRATDDSVRTETPSAGRTIIGGPRPLPASIWPAGTLPGTPSSGDTSPIEVGVRFRAVSDGFITGIRFFKGTGNTGTHLGRLWTDGGSMLATVAFEGETPTGWQQALFDTPVAISADTTYVASYFAPNGDYAVDAGYFTEAYDLPPLRALANGEDGPNGVYRYGSAGFPTSTYGAANYWVDIVYDVDDDLAPTVVDHSPALDVAAVATTDVATATFREAMTASSIGMSLTGPGGPVAGSVSYDAPSRTATFTPADPLDEGATFVASVDQAEDAAGNPMEAPVQWSFTTATAVGALPGSLWDSSATPALVEVSDPSPVELGIRFSATKNVRATAIRFYKGPGNVGPHTGHLWTLGGTLLATVGFSNESASGWQQADLATPVDLAKNQVYVVSYHTASGNYAVSGGFFGTGHDRAPLRGHAASEVGGDNGVYVYGDPALPSSSWGDTNYWVDVLVEAVPDLTPPEVIDFAPSEGLQGVAETAPVVATFDEPVDPATATFTLTGPGGAVAASVAYDAGATALTLTPDAPLADGTSYSVSVQATDLAGQTMVTPHAWGFTTATPAGATPATIWDSAATPATAASDGTGVELGVKLRADVDGAVTAIRFFKVPASSASHVGHLWTATGTLLGTASFAGETASGWQQADFADPIPITAGQTYVASYHAPDGSYGATPADFASADVVRAPLRALRDGSEGPNGVYRYGSGGFPTSTFNATNYLVDVVFTDTAAPTVTSTSPAASATDVPVDVTPAATFSEAVDPGSVALELRDDQGALVAGAVTYDGPSRTATFTPDDDLASLKSYTATVAGATDVSGNAIAAPVSWAFTTAETGLVSLFSEGATPAAESANDPSAIEVGMKFHATTSGEVRGVRFFKGPANTGTHVGSLWTAGGTLLASVTFTSESATGWQHAAFSSPVPVSAGTTYVVSYHTPSGGYAVTSGFFNPGDVTNGPLVGHGNYPSDGNGVYGYGAGGGFPTSWYGGANYWVDVVFKPSA